MGIANVAAQCRRGRFSRSASGERCALAPTPILSLAGRGVLGAMLVVQLTACGSQPTQNSVEPTPALNQTTVAQPEPPKIPCALAGAPDLVPVCTFDTTETPGGTILTLRHPDGAFHRLQITRDGRGVVAADGAEPAKVTPLGRDQIEVELGGARYRLPATVRGETAR